MDYIDNLTLSKNRGMIEGYFDIFEKIYISKLNKTLGVMSNLMINKIIEKTMESVKDEDKRIFSGFLDLFIGILFAEQDFYKAKKSAFALISVLH